MGGFHWMDNISDTAVFKPTGFIKWTCSGKESSMLYSFYPLKGSPQKIFSNGLKGSTATTGKKGDILFKKLFSFLSSSPERRTGGSERGLNGGQVRMERGTAQVTPDGGQKLRSQLWGKCKKIYLIATNWDQDQGHTERERWKQSQTNGKRLFKFLLSVSKLMTLNVWRNKRWALVGRKLCALSCFSSNPLGIIVSAMLFKEKTETSAKCIKSWNIPCFMSRWTSFMSWLPNLGYQAELHFKPPTTPKAAFRLLKLVHSLLWA